MKSPLKIKLRSGEELLAEKLGLSGYVAAPMGGLVLGGTPSREHVGRFCIGVSYLDGESGIIAQEEIAEIRDADGDPVSWGNAKFPGHPDFDPRNGFDPVAEQKKIFDEWLEAKEKRERRIEREGLTAILEEELRSLREYWGSSNPDENSQ